MIRKYTYELKVGLIIQNLLVTRKTLRTNTKILKRLSLK